MKAIVREKYGLSDRLKLQDIKIPTPKDHEVLIKVRAVSINSSDVENMRGTPLYIKANGLFTPNNKILGSDIAGTVAALGSKVSKFKIGDAVFGDALYVWGGFAEYACVPEKMLTLKPDFLSFEDAATLLQSAVVAFQGVRYKGVIKPGKHILINGAGGGSGTFAIQMAKLMGAEVTGVDSSEKQEIMRAIGADYIIDYTKEDFTKNGKHYDLILDLVACHSIFEYKRSLTPNGVYGMVGGFMKHIFNALVLGRLISLFGKKKLGLVMINPNKNMDSIIDLVETGKLNPVIDKIYSLAEVPEAMQYQFEGHAKGKVVIRI